MGNISDTSNNKIGQLNIHLNKEVYYTGEYITGTVSLLLNIPINTNFITIGVRGTNKMILTKLIKEDVYEQR